MRKKVPYKKFIDTMVDAWLMEFLPNLLQYMKELRNITSAVTFNHPEQV
jgi:hypothetical protein